MRRILPFLALFMATPACAQSAGPFANRNFDIRFTEIQITEDPERPEIPQRRRTQIQVGTSAAATRISRNWDRPPPAIEHLDASGMLGSWVSLQNRARLRHAVDGKRLTQTILTRGFATRLVIELDGAGCKARIDHALQPGETHFRMRNIALGTPMLIREIRTIEPTCAIGEDVLW